MPLIDDHCLEVCELPQDNAPVHSAKHTRDYFMNFPFKSLDLNCIENCKGEISRRLYDGGRQFDTVEDLLEALHYEW